MNIKLRLGLLQANNKSMIVPKGQNSTPYKPSYIMIECRYCSKKVKVCEFAAHLSCCNEYWKY